MSNSDAPLTPAASPSDTRIVVDCPTCRRVIWNGSVCRHGEVPVARLADGGEESLDVPKEPSSDDLDHKRRLRGGTGR